MCIRDRTSDVDTWSFYSSRFDDFAHHLAWGQQGSLTARYTPQGRIDEKNPCPPIDGFDGLNLFSALMSFVYKAVVSIGSQKASGHKKVGHKKSGKKNLPPQEFTSAPDAWQLPAALANTFGAIDDTAPQRFMRMAEVCGVRFGRPSVDRLDQLLRHPDNTELAALMDGTEQIIGFWLRTPEPVDWRRVSASLKVRHVEPAAGCPASHANRNPLVLDVDILPSPDFASAFLTARFGGDHIYLPRGDYELTLHFDPAAPGLPHLYPTAAVGPVPETVVYRFSQPLGLNWPLPAGKGHLHIDLMLRQRDRFVFSPHLWERSTAADLVTANKGRGILGFLGGLWTRTKGPVATSPKNDREARS